jgi:hypothetical protein
MKTKTKKPELHPLFAGIFQSIPATNIPSDKPKTKKP